MLNKLTLQDIFNDDPDGLLNVKPVTSAARNEDERLVASFMEIIDFYQKNKREPKQGAGIQEHQLYSRLQSLRIHPEKRNMLLKYDCCGLLHEIPQQPSTLVDILHDDGFGLLDNDPYGLFDLKHITPQKGEKRASTDFVARRKPCKDFDKYEQVFKKVQKDLSEGKRKLLDFKIDNLREGAFYVLNGIVFYIEKIDITQKEHYKANGVRVKEDGRTRIIFENGTESNMLKRSIEKLLYINGRVISENADEINESFLEKFSNITDEDKEAGYIYILKSKSEKQEIKSIHNLYKIGYSNITVEERIRNAAQEPTYLMADVRIVMAYKCFNMNTQKLEQLLHNFFGKSCLNIDVFDQKGQRHTPREWFIAPLNVIERAIHMIISGEIIGYLYDEKEEDIVRR